MNENIEYSKKAFISEDEFFCVLLVTTLIIFM